jgi:hypothetical protein
MSPTLVHFPDRESRIVMNIDGRAPRPGDEFISGWIVERLAPAPSDNETGCEHEVWVKPIS